MYGNWQVHHGRYTVMNKLKHCKIATILVLSNNNICIAACIGCVLCPAWHMCVSWHQLCQPCILAYIIHEPAANHSTEHNSCLKNIRVNEKKETICVTSQSIFTAKVGYQWAPRGYIYTGRYTMHLELVDNSEFLHDE